MSVLHSRDEGRAWAENVAQRKGAPFAVVASYDGPSSSIDEAQAECADELFKVVPKQSRCRTSDALRLRFFEARGRTCFTVVWVSFACAGGVAKEAGVALYGQMFGELEVVDGDVRAVPTTACIE
ncbi:MAG: hypothetical protein QM765_01730 [Myxococcales bacterium]